MPRAPATIVEKSQEQAHKGKSPRISEIRLRFQTLEDRLVKSVSYEAALRLVGLTAVMCRSFGPKFGAEKLVQFCTGLYSDHPVLLYRQISDGYLGFPQ